MSLNFKLTNITEGFWKKMQEKNQAVTIEAVYKRFKETGRFEAMKCNWKEGMENKPHIFWDSDVAKWIEGAAYVLAKHEDAKLLEKVEEIINDIESNQWEDGYFNVYYTVVEPKNRFKFRANHELYCAGHLIEAAVAYYECTGKDRFLKIMIKYVDLIYKVFVKEKSADFVTPGHQEIELALIRLYRCVKNKKYLDLCKFFIDNRGNNDKDTNFENMNDKYAQNDIPARELKSADGHAVRAMYYYAAMADLAKETNDKQLFEVCKVLYEDVTERKMCITGGIGSTYTGEAFTVPYDLPNMTAYNETCASIGLAIFADKMLENEIDSRYADIIERVLYNGIISGISLDGKSFFYENPLEISLKSQNRNVSTIIKDRLPITKRQEVFECSCCPPNINRVFASVEKYIYGMKDDVFYVNQYMDSIYDDGKHRIVQKTDYPFDGMVKINCTGIEHIAIRIPNWCDEFYIDVAYELKNGYAYIRNPQNIELKLIMNPKFYMANTEVDDCANKVALMYGPMVYCIERIDNPINLHSIYVDIKTDFEIKYCEKYGVLTVNTKGFRRISSNKLYEELTEEYEKIGIKFIPYYAFANRDESDMLVWLNYRK